MCLVGGGAAFTVLVSPAAGFGILRTFGTPVPKMPVIVHRGHSYVRYGTFCINPTAGPLVPQPVSIFCLIDCRCNLVFMEPPEIYRISPPGISREKLEEMTADGDKSVDELQQEQKNLTDLRELPKRIEEAVRVNKTLSRRLSKRH